MSLSRSMKHLTSLFVLMILTACHLPGSKTRPGEPNSNAPDVTASADATFFLTSLNGQFTTLTMRTDVSLPASRMLTVTACFRDKKNQQPIIGHSFLIRGGPTEQTTSSDGSACIVWTEEIKYNYLADEKVVTYSRDIIPQGIQKGSLRMSLYIDPWAEKVFSPKSGVVTNAIPADKANAYLAGLPTQPIRSLFIQNPRAHIVQQKIDMAHGGGHYVIDIVGSILGERVDASDTRVTFDILNAQVKVRVQLFCAITLADSNEPQRIVIAQPHSGDSEEITGTVLNSGQTMFRGEFKLKEYCATTSTLMVGISAYVVSNIPKMGRFEGIFSTGPVQNTVGMTFSMLDGEFAQQFMKDRSMTVEDFLAEGHVLYRNGTKPSLERIDETKKSLLTQGLSGRALRLEKLKNAKTDGPMPDLLQEFNIELVRFDIVPRAFDDIRGYTKKIKRQYFARMCLRVGIDGNQVRNAPFKLKKMNGDVIKVKTGDNGCFEWVDAVEYAFLSPECRTVEHSVTLMSDIYGLSRKIDMIMNPWADGHDSAQSLLWFSREDRDLMKQVNDKPVVTQCVKDKSQLIIGYYYQDYYIDRFQYLLDPYLGLGHMRMSNLSLSPKLARRTFNDRRGVEDVPLPPGKYLLRYAIVDQLVKDYSNAALLENHVYTVHRSALQVRGDGSINDIAPMMTAPEAIASLGVLNQLIVELVPLTEEAQNKEIGENDLEKYVDEDTGIDVTPFAGQLVFQKESGGFRQVPGWTGKSLVKHLEHFYNEDRAEIEAKQARLARKENSAKASNLTLVNYNSAAQVTDLIKKLTALPKVKVSLATGAVPMQSINGESPSETAARLGRWLVSDKMDRSDLQMLCGYFFNQAWKEKLKTQRSAYRESLMNPLPGEKTANSDFGTILQDACVDSVGKTWRSRLGWEKAVPLSAALDIEYKYFVKNPTFVEKKTCVENTKTNSMDCDSRPLLSIAHQTMSINESFSVAKDYGAGYSHGFESKLKGELFGLGGGWGFSFGSANFEARGNGRSFGKGMDFGVDILKFRIRAQDAERCISIRLNPSMVTGRDNTLYFIKHDSVFRRALREDITQPELNELLSRGLMICEGKNIGRPIEFDENYYFIRSGSREGHISDMMNSQNFKDWFVSLRGVKDFASFRSLFNTTLGTPDTSEPEVTPESQDFGKVQANFARGSRSMPGVYTSPSPLPVR